MSSSAPPPSPPLPSSSGEPSHSRKVTTKQRTFNTSDDHPIVFPSPSALGPAYPPLVELPPLGDIIIDPYDGLFCFVCRVNVPRSPANLTEHLGGKKHNGNNDRFNNLTIKATIRQRYIEAAEIQKKSLPPPPPPLSRPTTRSSSRLSPPLSRPTTRSSSKLDPPLPRPTTRSSSKLSPPLPRPTTRSSSKLAPPLPRPTTRSSSKLSPPLPRPTTRSSSRLSSATVDISNASTPLENNNTEHLASSTVATSSQPSGSVQQPASPVSGHRVDEEQPVEPLSPHSLPLSALPPLPLASDELPIVAPNSLSQDLMDKNDITLPPPIPLPISPPPPIDSAVDTPNVNAYSKIITRRPLSRSEKNRQKVAHVKQQRATALLESVEIKKESFIEDILKDSDDEERGVRSDECFVIRKQNKKTKTELKEEDEEEEDGEINDNVNDNYIKIKNGDDDDVEKNDEEFGTMRNYNERRLSAARIVYKPPEGPDYFLESMAPETPRSDIAANIRETFATTAKIKHDQLISNVDKDLKDISDESSAANNGNGQQQQKGKLEDEVTGASDFIPMKDIKKEEEERLEEELLAKQAMDECFKLRDVNGDVLPPWFLDQVATDNVLYSADSSIALHFEVLQFSQFMSPTQLETQARKEMIMTVESISKKLWPDCTVDLFGSYATGLTLSSSDVDVCVMNTPKKGVTMDEFETFAEAVRSLDGFAKRVKVVHAKVPLVKIISRRARMNCDVSIGIDNGVKNVPRIKAFIQQFPALRHLLLVVKCFLTQRGMNEAYTGGLGSYTLLLMVVSHLQMLAYNFPNSKCNLGMQLQSFFELYGTMLNFATVGLQIKDGGRYFEKFRRYGLAPGEVLRYCVEDPNDTENELGRNGYYGMRVRSAFTYASKALVEWRRDNGRASPTPLGQIINTEIEYAQRRKAVIEDLERRGEHPLRERVDGHTNRDGDRETDTERTGDRDEVRRRNERAEKITRPSQFSSDRSKDRDPRLGKRRWTGSSDEGNDMGMVPVPVQVQGMGGMPVMAMGGAEFTNEINMNTGMGMTPMVGTDYGVAGNMTVGHMNNIPYTPNMGMVMETEQHDNMPIGGGPSHHYDTTGNYRQKGSRRHRGGHMSNMRMDGIGSTR